MTTTTDAVGMVHANADATATHGDALSSAVRDFLRQCGDRGVEATGRDPTAIYLLADACRRVGQLDLWRRGVRAAFTLDHVTDTDRYMRARAKLTLGDWSGWTDYEARHGYRNAAKFHDWFSQRLRPPREMWDGAEDLHDKTVLLYAEHGFGSTIQMLRFVPEITRRAKQVILAVKPPLITLVRRNVAREVDVTFLDLAFARPFDRAVLTMSLPHLCGALPPFCALVVPDSRRRLPPRSRAKRAGLCWSGSDQYIKNKERSMRLQDLGLLLSRTDTEWVSLCPDKPDDAALDAHLLRPEPALWSYGDTAHIIAELDFVVTVDTSIAHLSAALGVPTFVLLQSAATWRWGLEETTPWYPAARLFRQTTAGDWSSVVGRVGEVIDALPGSPAARIA